METAGDEPSLQDALRYLHDSDANFTALFGLDKSTSTFSRARHTPTERECPSSGPNSRHHERTKLLQQHEQMQSLLASSLNTTTNNAIGSEWEEIAKRQREQRHAVEAMNTKLRKIVEQELKTARRVSALVGKATIITTALGVRPEACVDHYKGPQLDPHTHLAHLDALVREAQVVFSSGCFAEHAGRDLRDVDCRNLGPAGPRIELSVSWVLPFDVERVVQALWVHTTRVPRTERTTSFKDVYTADRTLVSRFVSEAKVLGTIDAAEELPVRGSSHGQIATQYTDPAADGSMLLVSNMDVMNFHEDGSCRSLLQADGFVLVAPLLPRNSTAPACRVQWCRRLQSCAPGTSAEAMAEYSKWAHVLTSRVMQNQWWATIEQNLQEIENMLCDVAIGERNEGDTLIGGTSGKRICS